VKDGDRAHAFCTEAMGYTLAKVVKGTTPEGGWTKHVCYDTGFLDGAVRYAPEPVLAESVGAGSAV